MNWSEALPHVNAFLNAVAATLLVSGYVAIRQGRKEQHARLMLSAFVVSVLFLVSYLIYHWQAGHVRYEGQGVIRIAYLTILFSHIVLAATVPFLALTTLYFAFQEKFDRHRRWARVTLPIWLYVSVTGVIVYLMLYVLTP